MLKAMTLAIAVLFTGSIVGSGSAEAGGWIKKALASSKKAQCAAGVTKCK